MTSSSQPFRVAGEIWVQALIYSSPDDQLRICASVLSTVLAGAGDGVQASVKKKHQRGAKY